jgi:aromatic amino acid aminotransferase I
MPLFATHPSDSDVAEKRRLLNAIQERREKAGKLVAGVAAACNSDLFKIPVKFQLNSLPAPSNKHTGI